MKHKNMNTFSTKKSSLFLRLLPSLGILTFIIYPILVLLQPDAMLKDPGIGWHLISGRYMLDHKEILNHDIFSFTRPGEHWLTYEWLFQCFAAWLEKIGGLPLLTVASTLIYGSLPVLLYKRMLKENSNIYISLLLLFISFFGLTEHSHARPHIFTYFFFILLIERIFSYYQRKISSRSLFLFVPLMIFWVNLHGGFVVGLAAAGLAFIVTLGQFLYSRTPDDLNKTGTFFLFGCAMTLVTLINPVGWHLHLSILKYMSFDVIHKWSEFASPNFNYGGITVMMFEFLILISFLVLGRNKIKIDWLELVFLLFFLYHSLHAIRHIFLLFIFAVPILARELTNMIKKYDNWFTRRSKIIAEEQKKLKGDPLWIFCICAACVTLSLTAPNLFKTDLYGNNLSAEAGVYIKEHIDQFKRPFNTDNVGGALIYHFWPDIKVFADDRLDFYGEDFFVKEYMEVLYIKPKWEDIFDKYKITSAIVANQHLATLMTASPNWNLVYEDKKNYIFLHSKPVDR